MEFLLGGFRFEGSIWMVRSGWRRIGCQVVPESNCLDKNSDPSLGTRFKFLARLRGLTNAIHDSFGSLLIRKCDPRFAVARWLGFRFQLVLVVQLPVPLKWSLRFHLNDVDIRRDLDFHRGLRLHIL